MPFTAKQTEYLNNANRRWNFKVGATRSGKTYMDLYLIPKRIRNRIDKDGLSVILGVSKGTIERNVLEPMRAIWGGDLVGTISSNNTCQLFGETVYCLGAEKVSQVAKLRGASFKYCYGDEVAEWNPDVFQLLKSRLDKPYSTFDGALNPNSPNHWLKKFLDSDADIYNQHYTIFDNPYLPQEFVDNLCNEYKGTVYYKRYILGEWALAEGLIYPMHEEAIAEPPKDGKIREYCLSCDYGTLNAFAALLWAKIGDIWYVIDEYYWSGRDTGKQKTDNEYCNEINRWLAQYDIPKPLRIIIDPSAASFITLMRKTGEYTVQKANNDVLNGIHETASCMRTGKIKISPSCKNTIAELQGYVWDDTKETDTPLKVRDHAMDAMRYMVHTMRIAKISQSYISPFGGF